MTTKYYHPLSKTRLSIVICVGFAAAVLAMMMSGCSSGTDLIIADNDTEETTTATTNVADEDITNSGDDTSTTNTNTDDTAYEPSDTAVLGETTYDGWNIVILDDGVVSTLDGETIFSITFQLTNNSGESGTAGISSGSLISLGDEILSLDVQQNGTQCEYKYVTGFDTSWELHDRVLRQLEDNYSAVETGETIYIPIFYILNSDSGEISFEVADGITDDASIILNATHTLG